MRRFILERRLKNKLSVGIKCYSSFMSKKMWKGNKEKISMSRYMTKALLLEMNPIVSCNKTEVQTR